MTKGERIARVFMRGWHSWGYFLDRSFGNSPWTRYGEWKRRHWEHKNGGVWGPIYFRLDGKLYKENVRKRRVQSADGSMVTITERKLLRV